MKSAERSVIAMGLLMAVMATVAVAQDNAATEAPPMLTEVEESPAGEDAPGDSDKMVYHAGDGQSMIQQRGFSFGIRGIILILFVIPMYVLALIGWAFIFRKAGYSWALMFVMMIPLANLIWFIVFAFSKWPVLRKLEASSMPAPPLQQ